MDVKHTSEKQSLSKTMTEKLIMSKTYNSFVDTATMRERERHQIAFFSSSSCEALQKQTVRMKIIIINIYSLEFRNTIIRLSMKNFHLLEKFKWESSTNEINTCRNQIQSLV